MAKDQRHKHEKIITVLRQIGVLTINGKTLSQACIEAGRITPY